MQTIKISNNTNFRYEHYSPNNHKLVVLIAGFATSVKYFSPSIDTLQKQGFSVLVVEYDASVLESGQPEYLPELVSLLADLVKPVAAQSESVYLCGPSLGSHIAFNVMQRVSTPCIGIFAGGGIPVSHAIFHTKRFANIKKAFLDNSYDEKSLVTAWEQIETTSDANLFEHLHPFIIYAAKQDRIIDHKVASAAMLAWQQRGVPVEFKTIPMPGHIALSLWFMRNVGKLVVKDNNSRKHTAPQPRK